MPKIAKISGPPGCGKTTFLLRQLEVAARKYDTDKIGAISFTRAAVEEMRTRVAKTLGYGSADIQYIRTIHSIAYRLLGLDKGSIVGDDSKHIHQWNEEYPDWRMPARVSVSDLEDAPSEMQQIEGNDDNAKARQAMDILRGRCLHPSEWFKANPEYGDRAAALWEHWSKWMHDNDLWDFNRILEDVEAGGLKPDISVLFIDEAQDLSLRQLRLTQLWGSACDTVVYLGDSNQAIYRFAGACPEDFRDLQNDYRQVLSQSYRVSKAVHAYSSDIISQVSGREDAEYKPTDQEGKFLTCFLPKLDLPGSHMILCRANYQIGRWKDYLIKQGIPWHNPYRAKNLDWNPTETKSWTAARTYDRIRQGLEVKGEDIREMIGLMSSKSLVRGVKSTRKKLTDKEIGPYGKRDVFWLSGSGWFQPGFFNFSDPMEDVFQLSGSAGLLINQHGAEITRETPRTVVGTVHSVKGGEADNVWFDRTSTYTIVKACDSSRLAWDDECRIAYVACTRARDTLGILEPKGPRSPVLL